jgi:tetratricopeptide (TPR) repeat protein
VSCITVLAFWTRDGRERDLSPTALKDRSGTGGAARFLAFLKDELRPRIEGGYRTAPYRILVGHSLGGLFAIHTLTSAADAFNAYVAISPSLWWDDRRMLRQAETFFAGRSDLQAFLYFTVGNEPGKNVENNRSLAAVLKAKAPRGLQWEFRYMERESHFTTPHRSTYDALEALFAGWEPPAGLDTVKALQAHYEALAKRFPIGVKIPEAVLHNFGYELMEKRPDEAIDAFKLNVQLHPDSASVYDALGEALENSGQRDLARANYEIAVRKATESSDPELPAMKANLERLSK